MKTQARRSKKGEETNTEETQGHASKPFSLAPLTFDEALDGLLGVKPEPKGVTKEAKKRAAKKAVRK